MKIFEDIKTVKKRDPAARSGFEIFFTSPGVRALWRHRRAHFFYRHGFKLIARIISERTRKKTGIEIHPAVKIGARPFIDHGGGIVIGETTEIGDDVSIFQGVTLGGTGKETGKRHPTIGNRVVLSVGSKILGSFKVGDDSMIGAGSVVLKEVPPNSTVVGIPGEIVKGNKHRFDENSQSDLPNPIFDEITSLKKKFIKIQKELDDNIEYHL